MRFKSIGSDHNFTEWTLRERRSCLIREAKRVIGGGWRRWIVLVVICVIQVDHIAEILYVRWCVCVVISQIEQLTRLNRCCLQVILISGYDWTCLWEHVTNIAHVFFLFIAGFLTLSCHLKDLEELSAASFFVITPECVRLVGNRCTSNRAVKGFVILTDASALIPLHCIFSHVRRVNKLVERLKDNNWVSSEFIRIYSNANSPKFVC